MNIISIKKKILSFSPWWDVTQRKNCTHHLPLSLIHTLSPQSFLSPTYSFDIFWNHPTIIIKLLQSLPYHYCHQFSQTPTVFLQFSAQSSFSNNTTAIINPTPSMLIFTTNQINSIQIIWETSTQNRRTWQVGAYLYLQIYCTS